MRLEIGQGVMVEFIGEVIGLKTFPVSGVLAEVKIDERNTVCFVPVTACSPLQTPESTEIPLVGGDGSV